MLSPFRNSCLIAGSMLSLSFAAFGSDIQINGVCVQGTCPPGAGVDAINFNGSTSGNGSDPIVVNGDPFSVSWVYTASYNSNGTALFVNPTATYIGGSPLTNNDVITFNFFQNYFDSSPGSWDGTFGETVPLMMAGGFGGGSMISGQLFYTTDAGSRPGTGLGLVTLSHPGSTTGVNSANLTGLTGTTLEAEYEFTFDFGAGTVSGASESSPTPEPVETLPVGIALAVSIWYVARRQSGQTQLS